MKSARINFADRHSAEINQDDGLVRFRKPKQKIEFTFEEMEQIVKLFSVVNESPLLFGDEVD